MKQQSTPDKVGTTGAMHSMIDNLVLLRAFVAVVESGSFSEAGRRLRVVPSTVSKHINLLETNLRGQLVIRSTKKLSITELGRRFYDRCLAIFQEVEAAEYEIGEYNAEPQGLLRVSAATVFASHHLMPIFAKFLNRYPRVRIEVALSTVVEDMIGDSFDVAIRISDRLDPGLIALKLASNQRVYCASPAYLAEHGTPTGGEDLINHNCLLIRGVSTSARWGIRQADGTIGYVTVGGRFQSNNGDLVRQALLDGLGIGHLARFMVQEHLDKGELVELFPESRMVASHIYAVYPERRNLPLKTRAFVDLLREEFRVPPVWAR